MLSAWNTEGVSSWFVSLNLDGLSIEIEVARAMGNIRRVILLGSVTVERLRRVACADANESDVFRNAYVKLDRRGNGGQ